MEGSEETKRLVGDLLGSERYAALCTGSEIGPYSSLIAFWAADDLSHVVFATSRCTHRFNYLVTHPRVALLFDNRSAPGFDLTRGTAVTATGTAREVTNEQARAAAAAALAGKHPCLASFVDSPGGAVVRVDIDGFYVVTHLEDVVELHVHAAGRTG